MLTQSAGSPADAIASRITPTSASLVWAAADPPRSTAALPLFNASTAASTVTLGRAS